LTVHRPKPLADALATRRDLLLGSEPQVAQAVIVKALNQAAMEPYTPLHGQPNIATSSQVKAAVAEAQKKGLGGQLTTRFLVEEWEELVDAWQVADAEASANLPRLGRRTRLGPQQREAAWDVFEHLRSWFAERKLTTWPAIFARLTAHVERGGGFPFNHVVVDEAQDLSVAQVRFLAAVARARPDAVFLARQLILGARVSNS
jgi:hypothetical protein